LNYKFLRLPNRVSIHVNSLFRIREAVLHCFRITLMKNIAKLSHFFLKTIPTEDINAFCGKNIEFLSDMKVYLVTGGL